MKSFFTQTEREKRGTVDGVNLFFGALIGANLGSLQGVSLLGYTMVVLMLAGTVMAMRAFVESERRRYTLGYLALYFVATGAFLYRGTALEGLTIDDRARIAITMGVWVGTVVMTVLVPAATARPAQAGGGDEAAGPDAQP